VLENNIRLTKIQKQKSEMVARTSIPLFGLQPTFVFLSADLSRTLERHSRRVKGYEQTKKASEVPDPDQLD
jgi:hypothetical protein